MYILLVFTGSAHCSNRGTKPNLNLYILGLFLATLIRWLSSLVCKRLPKLSSRSPVEDFQNKTGQTYFWT